MEIKELQIKQSEFDKLYWEHNSSEFEKVRHITLHMGKLLGKLSTYCEAKEHKASRVASCLAFSCTGFTKSNASITSSWKSFCS